jgi:hypothetical protein
MILFGVQLFFNAAWSWLFFRLHSPGAALIDIVLLWMTIHAGRNSLRTLSDLGELRSRVELRHLAVEWVRADDIRRAGTRQI